MDSLLAQRQSVPDIVSVDMEAGSLYARPEVDGLVREFFDHDVPSDGGLLSETCQVLRSQVVSSIYGSFPGRAAGVFQSYLRSLARISTACTRLAADGAALPEDRPDLAASLGKRRCFFAGLIAVHIRLQLYGLEWRRRCAAADRQPGEVGRSGLRPAPVPVAL
jgi:hypothetical protein